MTEATPPFGAEGEPEVENAAPDPAADGAAPDGFAAEPDAVLEPELFEPDPAAAAAAPADASEPSVPFPVPEEVADYSPEELAPSLAALCFALNRPVTLAEAAAILGRAEPVVAQAADHLATTLRGGGLMLQRHQDELQLVTRREVAWAVQRALNPEKPGRLSRAALETLAIVAYRQPLTRAAVEAIRGVNCEAVLDSLERRGLIAEVGRQDTPGHPRLFGTTMRFLQVVGLERIEDLPPLPEGLKVPELPVADWDLSATPDQPEPTPGAIEVRGEAVPPDTTGYTTGGASTYDAAGLDREPVAAEQEPPPPYDADPDEGYGEPDPDGDADEPDEDDAGADLPGRPAGG